MVKVAASTSSPVTITVTSSGGSRSMGLTRPMPRRQSLSNNPNSPLSGCGENRRASSSAGGGRYLSFSKESSDEFVAYTVQIPPTPDNRVLSSSQDSPPLESSKSRGKTSTNPNPNESFMKDTIFIGGFNSATKAHMRKSSENETPTKSKSICAMDGCDEKIATDGKLKNYCDCGYGICRDCYLDCLGNGGGHCPGCKEPYKDVESEEEPPSEEKDKKKLNVFSY